MTLNDPLLKVLSTHELDNKNSGKTQKKTNQFLFRVHISSIKHNYLYNSIDC